MNRMTKALAMILVLAMALCVGTVPAAAEEEPDVVGAVQGQAYINEFFDLAFTLGDGWTFYTEEQLLELGGLTVDQLEGTDAQEYVREFVESDQGSYVMAAYAPDGLKNVNLVVQDLSQNGAVTPLLTDEMVAAAAFGEEGMQVFQSMGLEDLTIEQNRVELAGAEHPGARISYNGASMGIDAQVYQQSATFVRDSYSLQVTMTSFISEDGLDEVASYFCLPEDLADEEPAGSAYGAVDGNVYANGLFGLQCALPEDWSFDGGSAEEGLSATSGDGMRNIVLYVEDLGDLSEYLSEEDIVDSGKDDLLSSFVDSAGAKDGSVDTGTVTIAGEEHPGAWVTAALDLEGIELNVYMELAVMKVDRYAMIITLTAFSEDAIGEMEAFFAPLSA